MDLDDGKTSSKRERAPGVRDLVDVYKFPEKKWVSIRLLPGLHSTASYWVRIKKKDGSFTKFNVPARSYDAKAQELDSTIKDPWRDLANAEREAARAAGDEKGKGKDKGSDTQLVQFSQEWFMEAIIRSAQKQLPGKMPKPTKAEAKSGFKDKDSDSITPVRAVKLGRSLLGKIKELKGLNTVEKKDGSVQAYAVNDPKYGRDIRVYFDSSKAPADQYQVQLGDKRTPLKEEELAYLRWDLETACKIPESDIKDVMADFESWATRMNVKVKKARKDVDEDEDFDDEEDEKPSKSKKSKGKDSKKSNKSRDEDDEDDDEDDEEEDEKPSKSKKPRKSRDEEEDEDDFDDEDEDEDDDEDEDEDDEDDDEDDEKPSKSKKSKGKPVKGKSKKSSDDEEDDFDDEDEDDFDDEDEDEDDDDDEEDEKPSKSKKSKGKPVKGKSKKSKKSSDEDDEDDDF